MQEPTDLHDAKAVDAWVHEHCLSQANRDALAAFPAKVKTMPSDELLGMCVTLSEALPGLEERLKELSTGGPADNEERELLLAAELCTRRSFIVATEELERRRLN